MSAGYNEPTVCNDLNKLAPQFRASVEAALLECQNAGLDAIVFETYRSNALAKLYYARGRTIIPPHQTVTNAPDNSYSWHGFSLAADFISKSKEWGASLEWFTEVANIFKKHNCKWGGNWTTKDLPHAQWFRCKPSPSNAARLVLREQGMEAVWKIVGAD